MQQSTRKAIKYHVGVHSVCVHVYPCVFFLVMAETVFFEFDTLAMLLGWVFPKPLIFFKKYNVNEYILIKVPLNLNRNHKYMLQK